MQADDPLRSAFDDALDAVVANGRLETHEKLDVLAQLLAIAAAAFCEPAGKTALFEDFSAKAARYYRHNMDVMVALRAREELDALLGGALVETEACNVL